jgi:hypothetical protein
MKISKIFKKTIFIFSIVIWLVNFDAKGQFSQNHVDCTNCSDVSNNSVGQFTYSNSSTTFSTGDVSSDFGPRRIRVGDGRLKYDWHGGLDFAKAGLKGDAVCALADGTIVFIGIAGGIVDIAIQIDGQTYGYGYRHLFFGTGTTFGTQAGRFRYVRGTDSRSRYVPGIHDIQNSVVYTAATSSTFSIDGNTIQGTNRVTAGTPIAPIGNSGDAGYATHLHVQGIQDASLTGSALWSDNNAYNPLKFIQHQSPTYSLTFIKSTIPDVFTDAIPASEAGIVMQNAEKKKTPILFRA